MSFAWCLLFASRWMFECGTSVGPKPGFILVFQHALVRGHGLCWCDCVSHPSALKVTCVVFFGGCRVHPEIHVLLKPKRFMGSKSSFWGATSCSMCFFWPHPLMKLSPDWVTVPGRLILSLFLSAFACWALRCGFSWGLLRSPLESQFCTLFSSGLCLSGLMLWSKIIDNQVDSNGKLQTTNQSSIFWVDMSWVRFCDYRAGSNRGDVQAFWGQGLYESHAFVGSRFKLGS